VLELSQHYPEHEFFVQKSDVRAFTDEEYAGLGISLADDISFCDILLGVKEVEKDALIPGKTYLFFSHTAKMQPYNRELLQTAGSRKITLIDYEYLTKDGVRLVAFGYWAGIVGAYNALLGFGIQAREYSLKPAYECADLQEMSQEVAKARFIRPVKFILTGEGRVASGAVKILEAAGVRRVSPESFLSDQFSDTVFCQTGPQHYTVHREGKPFTFEDFVRNPQNFTSAFYPFTVASDVFIACHFWDPKSPVFFTAAQMREQDFRMRFVADISCDIGGPIPTTLRASHLEMPFYGVNRMKGEEIDPFVPDEMTVMAVDNLPGGIPRDASQDFGRGLMQSVLPELLAAKPGDTIIRATILEKGELTAPFQYLEEYLRGT
jgi:hypothetical protein